MFKIIGADQREYGPVSEAQIRQWISDRRLNASSRAQRATGGDWQTLAEFPEFADLFQPAGETAPAPGTAAAPAPMTPPTGTPIPTASREMALSAVKGPAIALIITAGLGIALYFLGTIGQLIGFHNPMNQDMSDLPPQLRRFVLEDRGISGILGNLLGLAINGAILFGAVKMMRLQGHAFAIITCILAMLPCSCCCFVSIAFAIWGLVVLNKPEVKSQFTN
jgi:hypothetical protein